MKQILNFALILGLNFSVAAMAGDDRGGGGGICVNDKCITVPEAGFRIAPEQEHLEAPIVPAATFNDIRTIFQSIQFDKITGSEEEYIGRALAYPSIFVRVRGYNEQKFGQYKEEYLKLLKANGMSTEGFALLAVSAKDEDGNTKTYLLPEFYKANTRTQALTLIHESRIRGGMSVQNALYLDGKILDFLQGKISRIVLIYELYYRVGVKPGASGWSATIEQEPEHALAALLDLMESRNEYFDFSVESNGELGVSMYDSLTNANIYERYPQMWALFKEKKVRSFTVNPFYGPSNFNKLSKDEKNKMKNGIKALSNRCKTLPQNKKLLINDSTQIVSGGYPTNLLMVECVNQKAISVGEVYFISLEYRRPKQGF